MSAQEKIKKANQILNELKKLSELKYDKVTRISVAD